MLTTSMLSVGGITTITLQWNESVDSTTRCLSVRLYVARVVALLQNDLYKGLFDYRIRIRIHNESESEVTPTPNSGPNSDPVRFTVNPDPDPIIE